MTVLASRSNTTVSIDASNANNYVQWLQPLLIEYQNTSPNRIHINLTKKSIKNAESSARSCDRLTGACCDRFTLKFEYRPCVRPVKIHFTFCHNQPELPPEVDVSSSLPLPPKFQITTDELQDLHPWNINDSSTLVTWIRLIFEQYERNVLENCVIKANDAGNERQSLVSLLDKCAKEFPDRGAMQEKKQNKLAPDPMRLAFAHKLLKVNVQPPDQHMNVTVGILMKLDAMLALAQYDANTSQASQPDVLVTAELKQFGNLGADVNVHPSPYLTILLSDDSTYYLPTVSQSSNEPFSLERFVRDLHSQLTAEINRITMHQMQKARILGGIVHLFQQTSGFGKIRDFDEHLLTFCEAEINVKAHPNQTFLLRIDIGARGFQDNCTASLRPLNGDVEPVYRYNAWFKLHDVLTSMQHIVQDLISLYEIKVQETKRLRAEYDQNEQSSTAADKQGSGGNGRSSK